MIVFLFYFLLNINLFSQNEFKFKVNNDIEIPSVKSLPILDNICLFSNTSDISAFLIKKINNAKNTIDIAIYSLTNENISNALIEAKKRGIKIRIIIEYSKINTSKIDPAISKLIDEKIPIKTLRGSGLYGIMHNKIMIIDSSFLITGSYNYTLTANNNNFENVVFVSESSNVISYIKYFETMWQKGSDIYTTSKTLLFPSDISQTLFTMIDTIRNNIIKLISYSQKKIDIAVYSISDDLIYNELLKAKKRGVSIRIVTDRLQSTQSETIKKLYKQNFNIKVSDGFNKGMMHNKYAIFDDSFVITGSFNWSNNAENYNWENAIILGNDYVKFFNKNFEEIYSQAKYYSENETPEQTNISR